MAVHEPGGCKKPVEAGGLAAGVEGVNMLMGGWKGHGVSTRCCGGV